MGSKTKKGSEAFDEYYRQIFPDRWSELHASLVQKKRTVHLANPFCEWSSIEQKLFTEIGGLQVIRGGYGANVRCAKTGLLKTYQLDEASLWPVIALLGQRAGSREPGDEKPKILDMCSAPGGKALALVFLLRGECEYHLNDMSEDRVARLKSVLRQYLPPELLALVRITKSDASRMGLKQQDIYAAVLLDAPCSSERHLLENLKELENWSPKRIQGLAVRQMGLICAALEVCKPGCFFVYSTCALSPMENEELARKFLKKRKGRVEIAAADFFGENRAPGYAIWPDQASGSGPIFYSVFRKL